MAVEMQQAHYGLPEKFSKLAFFGKAESTSSNESTDDAMSVPLSPTSPPATTFEPYEIVPILAQDQSRALEHLRKFFFRDEPLNISIGLLDESNTCKELEDFAKKCMNSGYSFMAVSESGQVVGVCVNDVDRKDAAPESEPCDNPKFQMILNLLETIETRVDIFGKYPDVSLVMNCKLLSVDSGWRGRGIAKNLLDKTREIAKNKGHGLMRVDCTSHFSAKAIARLGFECIYSLKYSDYKENGKVVFDPEKPHTEVKVYVQEITS